ncbi:MAG: hypothetical protein ACOZAN_03030 [Patescibacteria group bacterium]
MSEEMQKKWYQKSIGVVIFLILFFPVGLYLMWKHKVWNMPIRIILSVFFALVVMGQILSPKSSTPVSQGNEQQQVEPQQNSNQPSVVPTTIAKTQEIFTLQQAITAKSLETTITSVATKSSVGNAYVKETASEGGVLIAVDYKYKNISDKPLNSFNRPTVNLIDANGTEYDSDVGKTSTYSVETNLDSKVFSDLNPGITVKDAKVFEVSKDNFDESTWMVQVKIDGKKYLVKITE